MADVESTTWCECEHSLYDHANRSPDEPAGECFVGGCKCQRFWFDGPTGVGVMERVYLDVLDAAYQDGTLTWDHLNVIPGLVAELRVAREVICEALSIQAFLPLELVQKIDAYLAEYGWDGLDRHTAPSTPDQSEGVT